MKTTAFEYIVYKLVEWYKESCSLDYDADFNRANDFGLFKILNLHFLVTSVNAKYNTLLSVFDNFYAMPYGNVEYDIYKNIAHLERFYVTSRTITIKNEYIDVISCSFEGINQAIKAEIDSAIAMLKKENIGLVELPALDLVDISQLHFSWQHTFNQACRNGLYSKPIPSLLIRDEIKYVNL
jgi:hypothetical protein